MVLVTHRSIDLDGDVVVNGLPLMLVPGTYVCEEAQRFGDKISTGDLKYADFTPSESGFAVASWHNGYGVRRYSDIPGEDAFSTYLEADGVECSDAGYVYLSPFQIAEDLPFGGGDTEGSPVWIGDFLDRVVCVAGNVVFRRDTTAHPSAGTWTRMLQLDGVAVRGAVGVFNSTLIIGYGASATADSIIQTVPPGDTDTYTKGNVTDTTPANLYIWAVTADRASVYVAGGPASTDSNKVTSSTAAATGYDTSLTTCGGTQSEITSLSPGGGLVIVFVGKETELGMINSSGVYQIRVPFDSALSANCRGMRWWMGVGGMEQRGPVIVVFPRDRDIWAYQPSGDNSGTAEIMSPWALPGRRPLNAMGSVVAIQGSARWLYYVVRNGDGDSWVIRRDARSGVAHNYLNIGSTTDCYALHITSLIGTNPLLFFGRGNNIGYVILPLDGGSALSDSACRFAATGTLTLPDADLGFPDENKVLYSERAVTDDLSAGTQTIEIKANIDGGSYTSLGTASSGAFNEKSYTSGTTARRWGRQLVFTTSDSSATPVLRGSITRAYLNTRLLRQWTFEAVLPPGRYKSGADPVQEIYNTQRTLWNSRASGVPVTFVDRWHDSWNVKVLKVRELEVVEDETGDRTIRFGIQLLETKRTGGNLTWGSPVTGTYDSPYAIWG